MHQYEFNLSSLHKYQTNQFQAIWLPENKTARKKYNGDIFISLLFKKLSRRRIEGYVKLWEAKIKNVESKVYDNNRKEAAFVKIGFNVYVGIWLKEKKQIGGNTSEIFS